MSCSSSASLAVFFGRSVSRSSASAAGSGSRAKVWMRFDSAATRASSSALASSTGSDRSTRSRPGRTRSQRAGVVLPEARFDGPRARIAEPLERREEQRPLALAKAVERRQRADEVSEGLRHARVIHLREPLDALADVDPRWIREDREQPPQVHRAARVQQVEPLLLLCLARAAGDGRERAGDDVAQRVDGVGQRREPARAPRLDRRLERCAGPAFVEQCVQVVEPHRRRDIAPRRVAVVPRVNPSPQGERKRSRMRPPLVG
jgi:hypothetical protein